MVTFILFAISILGAIAFSRGNLLIGILAFFIIVAILGVLRELCSKIKIEPPTPEYINYKIVFHEKELVFYLDLIKEFLQAYSTIIPDEWYFVNISQDWQHHSDSAGNYEVKGYLKFHISLGNWWDNILKDYPEISDYMHSIFEHPSERTFTAKFPVGQSYSSSFPSDEVNRMLQEYLDNYEVKNPDMRFERHKWGARHNSKN